MAEQYQNLKIRDWAEEDRPREKLLKKGISALSNAELIGILIGSGTASLSAVDVAKLILQKTSNDLNELAKLNVKELQKFKGIGEAKAITIVAAMELSRRRTESIVNEKPTIKSSDDAYQIIKPYLMDLPHEEFWVIFMNRGNKVIKLQKISAGGVSATVVDPKIIFRHALEQLASGLILVHNHPSGQLKPSTQDIDLTRKLKFAAQYLEITVMDHLILGENQYYSFADEGLM